MGQFAKFCVIYVSRSFPLQRIPAFCRFSQVFLCFKNGQLYIYEKIIDICTSSM